MSDYDKAIGDTLALVNVARQAFGKELLTELPTSKPGNSADCLYYRALADIGVQTVGGEGGMTFADQRVAKTVATLWGVEAQGSSVQAPAQFETVISAFDGLKFPHYNVGGTTSDEDE